MGQQVITKLRALCLRLPRTTETVTWGHPTFKVAGKTFCVLEEWRGHLTVCFKLAVPDAEAALADPRFLKTPYIGDKGWVSLIVDQRPDWKLVGKLALNSYWLVAPRKPRPRPATRRDPKAAGRGQRKRPSP